jgi:hypothetical protein
MYHSGVCGGEQFEELSGPSINRMCLCSRFAHKHPVRTGDDAPDYHRGMVNCCQRSNERQMFLRRPDMPNSMKFRRHSLRKRRIGMCKSRITLLEQLSLMLNVIISGVHFAYWAELWYPTTDICTQRVIRPDVDPFSATRMKPVLPARTGECL